MSYWIVLVAVIAANLVVWGVTFRETWLARRKSKLTDPIRVVQCWGWAIVVSCLGMLWVRLVQL